MKQNLEIPGGERNMKSQVLVNPGSILLPTSKALTNHARDQMDMLAWGEFKEARI